MDTCKLLDGVLKPPRLLDGVLNPPRLLEGVLKPPRLLWEVPRPPRLLDGVPKLLRPVIGELCPNDDEPIDGTLYCDRDEGKLNAPEAETISPATSRTISATITRFISLPSTRCCVE